MIEYTAISKSHLYKNILFRQMSKRHRVPNLHGHERIQRSRATSAYSSRKRSHTSSGHGTGQKPSKRSQFVQHALSRIVHNAHPQSTTEIQRKAFLDRKKHARGVRLRVAGLRHEIMATEEQCRRIENTKTNDSDIWAQERKKQDIAFLQGKITDLKESLAELRSANPGVDTATASRPRVAPIVHTLKEEHETQELLLVLEKMVREDKNNSLKELGDLRRVVHTLRGKRRDMRLSTRQDVRLGHVLGAMNAKGWRIPREVDKMLIL